MALSKTATTVHGFEAVNAYHRIEKLSVLGKDKVEFHVRSYVDKTKPFFAEQVIEAAYDLNGANPIAQAYEHLKTLPEFTSAEDC